MTTLILSVTYFRAPDVILARLPGFIQEFSSNPILPDFLYELQQELASKMPQTPK